MATLGNLTENENFTLEAISKERVSGVIPLSRLVDLSNPKLFPNINKFIIESIDEGRLSTEYSFDSKQLLNYTDTVFNFDKDTVEQEPSENITKAMELPALRKFILPQGFTDQEHNWLNWIKTMHGDEVSYNSASYSADKIDLKKIGQLSETDAIDKLLAEDNLHAFFEFGNLDYPQDYQKNIYNRSKELFINPTNSSKTFLQSFQDLAEKTDDSNEIIAQRKIGASNEDKEPTPESKSAAAYLQKINDYTTGQLTYDELVLEAAKGKNGEKNLLAESYGEKWQDDAFKKEIEDIIKRPNLQEYKDGIHKGIREILNSMSDEDRKALFDLILKKEQQFIAEDKEIGKFWESIKKKSAHSEDNTPPSPTGDDKAPQDQTAETNGRKIHTTEYTDPAGHHLLVTDRQLDSVKTLPDNKISSQTNREFSFHLTGVGDKEYDIKDSVAMREIINQLKAVSVHDDPDGKKIIHIDLRENLPVPRIIKAAEISPETGKMGI